MNRYPTVRLDYQPSGRHRLTWSMNNQYFGGGPDFTDNREAYYPGFPVEANQSSTRRATSGWTRSTLGNTMVNEARIGYSGAPVVFAEDQFSKSLWEGSVANQGGYYLNLAQSMNFTTNIQNYMNAGPGGTTSSRDANLRMIEDSLSWLKGSHNITLGGNYTEYKLWAKNQQIVPEIRFGLVTGDPAESLFTAANFPGASATDLAVAGVSTRFSLDGSARSEGLRGSTKTPVSTSTWARGSSGQSSGSSDSGCRDSWRLGDNVTVSYGTRYDMTFPFVALNNSYSIGDYADVFGVSGADNLFKPGVLTGKPPEFHQLQEGERAYPMDWNNIAPSVGVAWTPTARTGWLHRLTGETGDLAVRAGYSRSFTRLGLGDFTAEVGDNPGVSLNAFRQAGLGNLGAVPLLFRSSSSSLGPASFPTEPTFPMTEVVTGDIRIFSPELRVPSADTWQAGLTRAISHNMAVEVRYLGARSADNWRRNDYNELNILENGFLDEFRLAMANLQANNAAGGTRAGSFAYFGSGTGTSPLPIYLAYLNGVNRDRAGDPSLYTSAQFRNANYVNPLARFNPDPYAVATLFSGTNADAALRANALRAGLPSNFFVANPDLLGGANIVENTTETMFHSMALEFRRRSSGGLQYAGSYVFGHGTDSRYLSKRVDPIQVRNDGTVGDVTHALKFNAIYELPFGRGKHFGSQVNGVVDRIIGGWQVSGLARVQSGRLIDLGNVAWSGCRKTNCRTCTNCGSLRRDACSPSRRRSSTSRSRRSV